MKDVLTIVMATDYAIPRSKNTVPSRKRVLLAGEGDELNVEECGIDAETICGLINRGLATPGQTAAMVDLDSEILGVAA